MSKGKSGIKTFDTQSERTLRKDFVRHFKACPIPDDQLLSNLGLFLNSKNLSRILFMNHLYQHIIDIPGVIMEFGVRWGQNMSLFAALRGIYDPFNRHRTIVGFDTFKGFPSVSDKDGTSTMIKKGNLSLTKKYDSYLDKIMDFQEKDNTLAHLKKYALVKGDATVTIGSYLRQHPQTIVAMAYFDFDLYEPTKKCLQAIKPYLVKGSVVGFDELNDPDSPGETVALKEVFGLNTIHLRRFRYASRVSYFVVE
jgi:hypothetical protein